MSTENSGYKLLLIEDFDRARRRETGPDLDALREQLQCVLGFNGVSVAPNGRSSAFATVSARNQRELERAKSLVQEHVKGWKLADERQFNLPKTF